MSQKKRVGVDFRLNCGKGRAKDREFAEGGKGRGDRCEEGKKLSHLAWIGDRTSRKSVKKKGLMRSS